MKKILFTGVLILLGISIGFAQKEIDKQAIKNMCGCYEVSFEYAETFAADTAYKFHKPYKAKGLEWVVLDEENKDKLVLQHLLVINDTFTIKHWRQDWLFENTDLLVYQKEKIWKNAQIAKNQVKGQWTQKVYEVDDSPRYEGSATWIHLDGKHFWESNVDAPLPRREYTKRDDYNVMHRKNRHEIIASGWLHEQDNDKIMRSEAQDRILVKEKGMNAYKKVEESRCKTAQIWWTKNQAFWSIVRNSWTEVLKNQKEINLKAKVDGKFLGQVLDEIAKKPSQNLTVLQSEISNAIKKYLAK